MRWAWASRSSSRVMVVRMKTPFRHLLWHQMMPLLRISKLMTVASLNPSPQPLPKGEGGEPSNSLSCIWKRSNHQDLIQHAGNALLPGWQVQAEGDLQLARVKARVVRASGRRGKSTGGHRGDLACFYFDSVLHQLRLGQHVFCIPMPAGFTAGGQVIQPGICGALQHVTDGVGAHVCNQLSTGRRSKLVVDDGQAIALAGQTQHCFGEVAAARRVDPAGAQNEVLR